MTRKQKERNRFIALFVMSIFAAALVFPIPLLAAPGDPLTVTDMNTLSPQLLVEALVGQGVSVSNIQFHAGANTAAGTFSGDSAILGLAGGIVLGTGDINQSVPGPNDQDDVTGDFGAPGDPDLSAIVRAEAGDPTIETYDATVLEFDFVPQTSRLTFQYVFASDEYNEYVNSEFNDVFAFFLNGANVALVPGTSDRVCVNNINNGNPFGTDPKKNPQYYRNNDLGDGGGSINTEMDGLTTVLTIDAAVNQGATNHIKLAIADTSDSVLDSNVFISNFKSVLPPQLQFSAAAYSAGEGDGTAAITVTRTGDPDIAASADYTTGNGTATAGADYTAASGTLNFAPGETSKTFSVAILEDGDYEGDETVNLSLSNASGASLGSQSTAVLTIVDNDTPPGIHFSQAAYSVNENAGSATITVTLTGSCGSVVSAVYSTSNGTATAGSDYSTVSGTVYFNSGETGQTFTIPILNDSAVEGDETVNLTLSDPSGVPLSTPDTAVLTIVDDDAPPAIQFSQAAYSVNENAGSATITVIRTGNSESVVSAVYSTSNGTATAGSDYGTVSGTVYFDSGETSKTFTVPILDDTIYEGNETVNLSLSGLSGAGLGNPGTAVLTIVENDSSGGGDGGGGGGGGGGGSSQATLKFSQAAYSADEKAGSATITVSRTGSTSGEVSVKYASSGGTATAGTDYTAVSGTLEFSSGETSKTFTVPVLDDSMAEDDETVNLTLSDSSGAVIGSPGKAVLTIIDDDKQEVPAVDAGIPTDIAGHWAHDCILALLKQGIIVGYPDLTIRPKLNISRAEAAVLVVNALGLNSYQLKNTVNPYQDDLPAWAQKAVLTVTENQIMQGYPDGTFRPDTPITRAEMCALLINAYKKTAVPGYRISFTDNAEIPAWALSYVEAAAGNQIVAGYPDGTFQPERSISRAEAFTMICKLQGYHAGHTGNSAGSTR